MSAVLIAGTVMTYAVLTGIVLKKVNAKPQ